MDVRDREKQPDVALVVVIDKSGSMDACHCNSFNGGDGRRRPGSGACPRSTSARRRSCARRRPSARATSSASWPSTRTPTGSSRPRRSAASATSRRGSRASTPNGQTNIFAGLDQAVQSLEDATATRRHIVLLTDGWSTSGQYDAILKQMKAAGITLSTVGAGGGSNPFLEKLAKQGGGRFYAADEPGLDPRHLPQGDPAGLRPADRRGAVLPDPDLELARSCAASSDGLPQLLGYNGTTAKPAAQTVLVTGARRPAARAVAVRPGAVGRLDVGRDRPLGPELGRLAGLLDSSSASWWAGRSRARRPAASRPTFVTAAGGRTCGSRARTATARRATSTTTSVAIIGPDLDAGRPSTSTRSPRASTRPRSSTSTRGAYAVRVTQTRPGVGAARPDAGAGRADRGRVPPAGRQRAAAGGDPVRRPAGASSTRRPSAVDPRPRDHDASSPTCGRGCSCWRCCCGRWTSRCGASRSAGASSPTVAAG